MMSYSDSCRKWQVIKRSDDVINTYHLLFSFNAVKFLRSQQDADDVIIMSTFSDKEVHLASMIQSTLRNMFYSSNDEMALKHLRSLASYIELNCSMPALIHPSMFLSLSSSYTEVEALNRASEFLHKVVGTYCKCYSSQMICHMYMAYCLHEEVPIIIERMDYDDNKLLCEPEAKKFLTNVVRESVDLIDMLCKV